jgi:cellulose synthase/poly-beta-1,6-N-acetylglucosamine synthase-like glycosyltransferase
MIFSLFAILGIYLISIILLVFGFFKVKKYEKTNIKPQTSFTIIVPFRNEAENLPKLLKSLTQLNYPDDLVELILVDDSSKEKFQVQSSKFRVTLMESVRVSNSPKKDAITTAMQHVKTDWVITTDADCLVNKNWLLVFDNYIQEHQISMLVGPVSYESDSSFLHQFQQLDFISLQGATIGSFGINKAFMCNGANFAYTKKVFENLKGFEGNNTIASGDDVFLLQKAVSLFPDEVHYLKSEEAIVITKPTENWKSLFYQRARWAAKTSSYKSTFGTFLGLIVFSGNFSFVILLLFSIIGIWSFKFLFFYFILKFTVDFVLLYITNNFLTNSHSYPKVLLNIEKNVQSPYKLDVIIKLC